MSRRHTAQARTILGLITILPREITIHTMESPERLIHISHIIPTRDSGYGEFRVGIV